MKFFKKSSVLRNIITGVIIAALCTAVYMSNILHSLDYLMSDALYQKAKSLPGDIVLINIDQYSLDMMGDFSYWGRETMGDVLNILNADPANAPAVVGIDVLYVGNSDDQYGDEYLAEMAGSGCPVVVACAAVFGSELETGDGTDFHMETNAVLAYDLPYEDLYYNSYIGHINSKFDTDGILRHGFWYIEPDGETEVPAFHRQIYELYCQYKGVEPSTVPVTDKNGAYYVPFQAKPGDFSDGYSVYDLLCGEIDPVAYAGKIVLIGPYAAGMQDDFPTAMDHATKMYGIEYQANMLQALINGETKREASRIPQAVAIFVIVLGMWVYLKNRRVMAATIVSLSVIAISFGAFLTAYSKFNVVLSPLYIPLYIVICYVVSVAVNYVRAALEKRRVTATFERYVAPEIVGELLKEGSDFTELKGRSCEIAVLFVDIRGFTSMSEVIPPEDVVEILDRYLTLTSSCIFKNKGTLDKFVGDCTMAFWGAPLPQDDIIFKAVKSAFDMVEGAADLKKELQEKYGRTVDFGVGVHYGPAVVGNIGSPNRMDFTAIGDTVNTASRLEANVPKGTIFVSRVVADALEGRVEFKSLGDTIKLKGKAEGFEVLEAVRILEDVNTDEQK